MELMTRGVRQNGMMSPRQVRGTVGAGLLCAALAGCGSVVAATKPAAPAAQTAAPAAHTATAVGCASVNQATTVTIRRSIRLVEPIRANALSVTERKPVLVRALFGDFCNAIAHADTPRTLVNCPDDFGLDYSGTFYDGSRALAKFVYGASGCQTVSITAGGKTRATMVFGTAAAAAPHLQADMVAVLGLPKSAVYQPQSQINPGGPNKPANSLR
jgi:uncharacterized protein YceK